MQCPRRIVVGFEVPERRSPLSDIPFGIAGFSNRKLDLSDRSGDAAFAFPGMATGVRVVIPSGEKGIKRIDNSFPRELIDSQSPPAPYRRKMGFAWRGVGLAIDRRSLLGD